MLFRPYRKRRTTKTITYSNNSSNQIHKEQEHLHNAIKSDVEEVNNTDEFSVHISKYIGQTVSIFVKSGGISGSGFTGILLSVYKDCIVLITHIGLAPACSLGNSCLFPSSSIPHTRYPRYFNIGSSITIIPIDKIACFVHNLT